MSMQAHAALSDTYLSLVSGPNQSSGVTAALVQQGALDATPMAHAV